MEYVPSGKLMTTAAVATSGVLLLRWLAGAPPPKRGAEARAELAKSWWVKYLQITPHFDQFIKDLVIKRMAPDGKASGLLVIKGPLLSSDGLLHEAGLFDLVDTFGSLSVMAAGYPAGVSLEIGVTILGQVKEGEELQVESEILRIGSTVGFTVVKVCRADGQLVASGTHTKHIGQPFFDRVRHNLSSRILPLARFWSQKGMRMLEDAVKSMPKAQCKTMEDALGLQALPPDNEHGVPFYAVEQLHLLNGYWAGHGASSAGLLAQAAREHLRQAGGRSVAFQDISVLYMNPVPPFKPVGFKVTPLSVEQSLAPQEVKGVRQYVVEMRSDKKIFVRARLTAIVS